MRRQAYKKMLRSARYYATHNGGTSRFNEIGIIRPMLERIYIGRRFKNDTERSEKLFELYTKMTAKEAKA